MQKWSKQSKNYELKSDFQEINIETLMLEGYCKYWIFGTNLQDPYRWLEDDHSEETKNWVIAQNKSTFDYLDRFHSELNCDRILKLY